MTKLGFAGIIVWALATALLALASPAQAEYAHHDWVGGMSASSTVYVPHVNTNAHR